MKQLSTVLLFFILSFSISAQHRDNTWILGYTLSPGDTSYQSTMKVDFSNSPFSAEKVFYNGAFTLRLTNASISTEEGSLQLFSNGVSVYNKDFQVVENAGLLPSSPASHLFLNSPQAGIFLPYPDTKDSIIFLTGDIFYFDWAPLNENVGGQKNFTYSVIDMSANDGAGRMAERKTMLLNDTMPGGMISAVRHANGRDWWTVVFRYELNEYYPILFTPQGPIVYPLEYLSGTTRTSAGQAAFSPDGSWYARYNSVGGDPVTGHLDIYRFDRCTGKLNNYLHKQISEGTSWGGIAFSPNSRFVYATAFDSIYQFDLEAMDILESQTLVAVYDSFTHDAFPNDSLNNFTVYTYFFHMATAPDGKIYFSTLSNKSFYLHTIEQPNLKGLACEVRQHSTHLPAPSDMAMPNMPNYNLGPLIGSPCDTIVTVHTTDIATGKAHFKLYPNPTAANITFESAYTMEQGVELVFYNQIGMEVHRAMIFSKKQEISLWDLPVGLYFYEIRDTGGNVVFMGKVIKAP